MTGGTSLIGAGVARALMQREHTVTVMQRGESRLELNEIRADLSDRGAVENALRGQDAVINVAAKVSVIGEWADFDRTNVVGTKNLLSSCKSHDVSRFVQISSPSVAHTGQPLIGVGATPADPEHARGHYARSKALAEQHVLAAASSSMKTVAIRPHLVWGPGDTQLVGRIVERARQGRLVLIGGGTALIDSTYVDNAVSAIVAALDRAPQISGEAFVVSNGQPRTVAELLERICAASGVPSPRRSVPTSVAKAAGTLVEQAWERLDRDEEPPLTSFLAEQLSTAHWFDQRRTRESLQWAPRISLAEGFNRLADSAQLRQVDDVL
ncbi:MAG TPA: NAD-dependent epimerase/dehydratase family protein [Actinomycetes bacterium]|nr:NAD-dependent epimerase/dehydratase family protein [Actinomycetes bacterium]